MGGEIGDGGRCCGILLYPIDTGRDCGIIDLANGGFPMPAKVVRLKLLPPSYSQDWDKEQKREAWREMKRMIQDAAWQVARVKNTVITKEGLRVFETKAEGKNSGKKIPYVKPYEIAKEILAIIGHELDKGKPVISGKMAGAAARHALDSVSGSHGKDLWKGNRSLPSFRRDTHINLPCNGASMYPDSKTSGAYSIGNLKGIGWIAKVGMWSRKHSPDYTGPTQIIFPIRTGRLSPSQKAILERILSGEYRLGEATLGLKNGEVYLNCSYNFEKSTGRQIVTGRVIGVDVGMKKVAVCAASDKEYLRLTIHDEVAESIRRHRAKMQRLRREAGRALRPYTDKRKGHGVKNKVRTLDVLSGRERDFQKTVNHQVSAAIVAFAKHNGAEGIAMEDLTGIYERGGIPQRWLRRWAYFELQQFVEYKAEEVGIEVFQVEARYTSQTCSKCGHKAKENRKSQAKFECVECGHKENADLNAARNIAALGFKKLEAQKEKEDNNN